MADDKLVFQLRAEHEKLLSDYKKAVGHTKRMSRDMKSVSTQVKRNLTGMFAVFSAGLIVRDIFNTVTGFEKQMDKVQAISGATAKEMAKLSESAVEIGKSSKFTASEIGKLQEELARLGFTSRQIIASTDAIRKLATAADAELGESAKSLAGTMNSFNIEAERSEEVANIMAESFSKSALNLEKFTSAMANVGATANAAGFNLSQTTAMVGILTNANIDASKAGTDLRKIFTELSIQGLTLEEALLRIRNAQDKNLEAYNLFGQRAATSAVLLATNAEATIKLTNELSDSNKELNEMVGIMEDNLITDLQKLRSAWDGWILSLEDGSGAGTGALRGLSKVFTDLLNGLSDWDKFMNGTDWKQIAQDNKKLAQVQAEVARIIKGETFDNVSVTTMNYADAVQTLDKRLGAFMQNRFYEDIANEIESYKNELKKANDEEQRQIDLFNQKTNAQKKLQATRANIPDVQSIGNSSVSAQVLNPFAMGNADALFIQQKKDIQKKYADFAQFMMSQNQMLNATIQESFSSAITGFADGIVTGGIDQAMNNIALAFANGISNIGDQLIAYGVTMIAAKRALENPFTNPGVAIAAGVAAKLAAAALKGAISNNSSGIVSSAGGSGGSGRGSFANNIPGQTISLDPKPIEIRFQNGSLTGLLEFENKRKVRTGSF